MVVHTCNPSTWEAEAGGLKVQDQTGLHGKLQASVGYTEKPLSQKNFKKILSSYLDGTGGQ
jgi:hypothetical protein